MCIHNRSNPTPGEWAEFCGRLAHLPLLRGRFRHLVFSDGGGPDNAMRREALATGKYEHQRLALVTGSVLVRGIGTVLAWFGTDLETFAPRETEEALRRFEMNELERAFVARTIAESLSKIDGGRVAATWFVDVGLAGKTSRGA